MVARWKLSRLKKQLAESIPRDYTQPGGWHDWLAGAGTFEELVRDCPEPGWLLHLAFWQEVLQSPLLDGALAAAHVAAQALGDAGFPLGEKDWTALRGWAETSEEERLRIAVRIEPRFSDDLAEVQVPEEELKLAAWLLAMATIHREAGKREMVADGVAKAVAILAAAAPERRTEMVQAMRAAFGW